MKIINKKGKLFGLINVVDLLILVAVLAMVAGISYKLFGDRLVGVISPSVEMTTVVRVRGATPYLVSELEQSNQVGKKLVSGNSYIEDAIIMSYDLEPYIIQAQTADGRIVDASDPSKKDLLFTITSTVTQDTAAAKIGTQEVRTGRSFIIKTNSFEMIGTIESVSFGE